MKAGCAVVLVALILFGGYTFWRLGLPNRMAMAAHDRMHAGMTLSELYAASGEWFVARGTNCRDGQRSLDNYSASSLGATGSGVIKLYFRKAGANAAEFDAEQTAYQSREELLRFVGRTPSLGACADLSFTYYVSGVPPRST